MSTLGELWDREGDGRLPRSRTGVIAFVLTALGFFLGVTVDMAFLILAAAGIFGPNLLRELGHLKDRDELQREAARLAAMRAFLVGGLFTMTLVITLEWGSIDLEDNAYSAVVLLFAYLLPYFFSYLTSFWGARKAAQRILFAFGLVWLIFNVLSNLMHPVAMLMQCLVAVPFFALGLLCRRFPRVTGVLLIAAGVAAFILFDLYRAFTAVEHYPAMAVILTFLLPLVYSGITLLGVGDAGEEA